MQKSAQEILNKIENHGYEAYIVGGFVRNYCLGQPSLDVDICTNATPKDLSNIFEGAIIPTEKYGAVTLIHQKIRYEITTYRKEIRYDDYRRPIEIEYVDNLLEDLKRRDFTINTLCMNSKGEIIDLLNGKTDLENKIIKTVDDAHNSLSKDVLRILRAIRFATSLDFKLDGAVKKAIIDNGHLLPKLSYTRKKEELTKIFTSPNAEYGVSLLREFNLGQHLELSNLDKLKIVDDILGIWAQLEAVNYPFSNIEKETITKVQEALELGSIDNHMLYKYGLYITSIVASIKDIDKKKITVMYSKLPIKSRSDININIDNVCQHLDIAPGPWIKKIYELIEQKIIDGNLNNSEKDILEYISNEIDNILVK